MGSHRILICTVGTSLFKPNLEKLCQGQVEEARRPLVNAYQAGDWPALARELQTLPAEDPLCGAEINSIASLVEKEHVPPDCGLFFLHSDTQDGRSIAEVLKEYHLARGHTPVKTVGVADLQDADAKRFRTKGLRELARQICAVIRGYTSDYCAINATGGYKAQIAVAVLLGQAIGVPVYYKHERFPEIISFPPMPVALDYELWMNASGLLFNLDQTPDPVPAETYQEDWNEKYESLIERVEIDGREYIALSPTGQIFHESFKERFRTSWDEVTPPPVPSHKKRPPRLEKAGWPGEHPEVERFMRSVTEEILQVGHCFTFYYNPDLHSPNRFRLGSEGIDGIFSNGSYTVKFRVETSAKTIGQHNAVVALLNDWLDKRTGR
jgi:putative CRISPR-associated protein (TIGR02619 family)